MIWLFVEQLGGATRLRTVDRTNPRSPGYATEDLPPGEELWGQKVEDIAEGAYTEDGELVPEVEAAIAAGTEWDMPGG